MSLLLLEGLYLCYSRTDCIHLKRIFICRDGCQLGLKQRRREAKKPGLANYPENIVKKKFYNKGAWEVQEGGS